MPTVSVKRVSELIRAVDQKELVVRPVFQRRLVWTNVVKDYFLETVCRALPFPEIFIATGSVDTKSMVRQNWLVDGQQRVSTLREYVSNSPDLVLKRVRPYAELTEVEKQAFLDYEVAVRDLGTITDVQIKEIFSRINSTDYALKAVEKLNALYDGAYKQFCEALAYDVFFDRHRVFSIADKRRMRDLDFCIILVTTAMSTYYHRAELNREYLERFNDEFPERDRLQSEFQQVFDFVEMCGFSKDARLWKKTDLFTLLVELHSALVVRKLDLDPVVVGQRLGNFYVSVDELYETGGGKARSKGAKGKRSTVDPQVFQYLKAATKATNDKYARTDRSKVISGILETSVVKPVKRATKGTKKTEKRP